MRDKGDDLVQRSPSGSRDQEGVVDEHAASSSTQSASGLGGGTPEGGPQRTPERKKFDEDRGREPRVKSGNDNPSRVDDNDEE
jgi:hypothetical protein